MAILTRIKQTDKSLRRALLLLMVLGNIALAVPIYYRTISTVGSSDPNSFRPGSLEVISAGLLELAWSSAILWVGVYVILRMWLWIYDMLNISEK